MIRSEPIRPTRQGFSLVELLVVIAVIAILIAISVPAIGKAIIVSREAVLLSRLHGIAQATEAYIGDNRGGQPQAGMPHEPDFSIDTGYLWRSYFAQTGFWTVALWPYFGEPNHPGMHSPWPPFGSDSADLRPPSGSLPHSPSSFQQNYAMFTQPRLWSATNPVIDETQLKAPKASAVAFPSRKTAFFLVFPSHQFDHHIAINRLGDQSHASRFSTPVALADSSAVLFPYEETPPFVRFPWTTGEPARFIEGTRGGLYYTIEGVNGRDF